MSGFAVYDCTLRVMREPERFHATELVRSGTLKQKASIAFVRGAYWLAPTYIWLLEKKP